MSCYEYGCKQDGRQSLVLSHHLVSGRSLVLASRESEAGCSHVGEGHVPLGGRDGVADGTDDQAVAAVDLVYVDDGAFV